MPFTPSHAVVALPFVRTPLVPAAIAIGAMTPDLALFTRGYPLSYSSTHDLRWLPATIVVALALLLLWRCVLRPAARELSPTWLAPRLPSDWDSGADAGVRETFGLRKGRVRGIPIVLLVLSLALGIASHVLWDQFTHEGRGGVMLFPILDEQWGPLTGYKWLQHGSSAFGLIVIAIWALLWLRRADVATSVRRVLPSWVRGAWVLALPVALLIAWFVGLAIYGGLDADFTVAHLAYRVLPLACAAWGALTVVLALLVQVARARVRQGGAARASG